MNYMQPSNNAKPDGAGSSRYIMSAVKVELFERLQFPKLLRGGR
jgi:hypothetical protein